MAGTIIRIPIITGTIIFINIHDWNHNSDPYHITGKIMLINIHGWNHNSGVFFMAGSKNFDLYHSDPRHCSWYDLIKNMAVAMVRIPFMIGTRIRITFQTIIANFPSVLEKAHVLRSCITLGNPQKKLFFGGRTTKRGVEVKTWPLRKKTFLKLVKKF